MKYTYNDISIVPAAVSDISSRSECDARYRSGRFPLFTAPMNTVVSVENFDMFGDNGITPILPRTYDFELRLEYATKEFAAFSLAEFNKIVDDNLLSITDSYSICIDVANGHMKSLMDSIRNAKYKYNNLLIMAGNIANPLAYRELSNAGCDYVRIGIGGGAGCITSSNTGVHYPMASLIKECYELKPYIQNPAKIVADGGIKNFSDINKALGLGADYVMCGSVFSKMLESAGETTLIKKTHNEELNQYSDDAKKLYELGYHIEKSFYGMSTKQAQREMGIENLRTSEGIHKKYKVEYTMKQWCDNFEHYLKTVMSYTSKQNLQQFIGKVDTIQISENSYNAINK